MIIAIIVDIVYFSASSDFDNYVREFEREHFEAVTGILEDEYANSLSWEADSLHFELLNLNQEKRHGVFWCYHKINCYLKEVV